MNNEAEFTRLHKLVNEFSNEMWAEGKFVNSSLQFNEKRKKFRSLKAQEAFEKWLKEKTQPVFEATEQVKKPVLLRLPPEGFNASGSKYLRQVKCAVETGEVDVYAVLETFNVTCPARQHAIKKLLCAGLRGKADQIQDLIEAGDAVKRAVQMQHSRAD